MEVARRVVGRVIFCRGLHDSTVSINMEEFLFQGEACDGLRTFSEDLFKLKTGGNWNLYELLKDRALEASKTQ